MLVLSYYDGMLVLSGTIRSMKYNQKTNHADSIRRPMMQLLRLSKWQSCHMIFFFTVFLWRTVIYDFVLVSSCVIWFGVWCFTVVQR